MKNKLIIVAGSSGSGKTTIAQTILQSVDKGEALIVCLDRFYLKNQNKIPKVASGKSLNYDHPDAFDWKLVHKCISDLLRNRSTTLPIYDYVNHSRSLKGEKVKPCKLIILEGTLPLFDNKLCDLASLKIYVDTPLDECFIRRLLRDNQERGRNLKSVITQWKESVKPMYINYLEPTKRKADLILPWEKENDNAIEILSGAIEIINK